MAMIKCPECGQEISDKAKKCVHCGKILIEDKPATKVCSDCGKENPIDATECVYCGCPFDEETTAETPVQTTIAEKPKKNLKKIIIPVVAAVVVIAVGLIIYNVKVVKPKNTYNEAMTLLEKGKYEEADKMLDSISGYKDVKTIQEQLKYESYVYECVNDWKNWLKNPDSFTLYDVAFYTDKESHGMYAQLSLMGEVDYSYPAVIFRSGAQNGFGGNTAGYELFYYVKDKGYTCMGSCNSLDENDYYNDSGELKDENDGAMEVMLCKEMNELKEKAKSVGDVDMDRLKTVLKNDAYSTIKIIE